MSANSKIEWCKHTFNPWWGCTKVSAGCANCYAERDSKRYGHDVWGDKAPRRFFGDKHWAEPLKWNAAAQAAGERHRVFCASMADVFEDREELLPWLFRLMDLIRRVPALDVLLVTKRPEMIVPRLHACIEKGGICPDEASEDATIIWLADWMSGSKPPPHNVWLLTSVENQAAADQRIPELLKVPAVVHGLSMEPLLGPVSLTGEGIIDECGDHPRLIGYMSGPDDGKSVLYPTRDEALRKSGINWVIVGGESGPRARPMHPDWPRQLRDQCQRVGIPFFFKQWGEFAPIGDPRTHFVCEIGHFDLLNQDGIANHRDGKLCPGSTIGLSRPGKKAAGRLLDARTWDEFPQLTYA